MEEEVVMTKRLSFAAMLAVGAIVMSLGVTACGVKGDLETPPPKDETETRDDAALDLNGTAPRA